MEFGRAFSSAILPGEGGLVNEQEWNSSTNPDAMNRLLLAWRTSGIPQETLKLIKGPALERKFRLFGCACARRIWHLIGDERPRLALEAAERYADGLADRSKLRKAYLIAKRFVVQEEREGRSIVAAQAACRTAYCTARGSEFEAYASVADFEARVAAGAAAKAQSSGPDKYELYRQAEAAEGTMQAQLLRDIFGNPFRAAPTFDSKLDYWGPDVCPGSLRFQNIRTAAIFSIDAGRCWMQGSRNPLPSAATGTTCTRALGAGHGTWQRLRAHGQVNIEKKTMHVRSYFLGAWWLRPDELNDSVHRLNKTFHRLASVSPEWNNWRKSFKKLADRSRPVELLLDNLQLIRRGLLGGRIRVNGHIVDSLGYSMFASAGPPKGRGLDCSTLQINCCHREWTSGYNTISIELPIKSAAPALYDVETICKAVAILVEIWRPDWLTVWDLSTALVPPPWSAGPDLGWINYLPSRTGRIGRELPRGWGWFKDRGDMQIFIHEAGPPDREKPQHTKAFQEMASCIQWGSGPSQVPQVIQACYSNDLASRSSS
jgi:hypothetical protein